MVIFVKLTGPTGSVDAYAGNLISIPQTMHIAICINIVNTPNTSVLVPGPVLR